MKVDIADMIVLGLLLLMCLILGYGFGFIANEDKLREQAYINERLRLEYNELRENYDTLEIKFNWKLEQVRELCYE